MSDQPRPALSPRERDVMKMIALGFTRKQAATLLRLHENTVQSYLKRIRAKYKELGIDAGNTARLVHRAIEDGVIEPIYPVAAAQLQVDH